MKKKNRTVIYLGCLSALMLTTSALTLKDRSIDHTEELCATTKFLNMIDKTGKLGMTHQLGAAAFEKDVVGVKYVEDYTKTTDIQQRISPTIVKREESELVAPEGYILETDEQGNKYAVREVITKEIVKPISVNVDGEEVLVAPEGYTLETDEQGNTYAVRIVTKKEKKELAIVSKTVSELVVPDGYTLETDENGNTYGKRIMTIHEDLGKAILSTYKDGKVKTLLLDKRN